MTIEIRAATLEERPAVQCLINVAFGTESYGPSPEHPCVSVGESHLDPHDRAENTRILLMDGEIVSVVHILERQAYACGDRVGFGMLAMVATHPEHRHQGYMRRLVAEAEQHMRERGLCYGVLLGGFGAYGGSLCWHRCDEKDRTPGSKRIAPAQADERLRLDGATTADVPFLAAVYEARYGTDFGPVIRSHEYWRRWSLQRPDRGVYVVVRHGATPIGYFHVSENVDVDDVGWVSELPRASEQVFLAASSWAESHAAPHVAFWLDDVDDAALQGLENAFGDLPRTFVDAGGHPVEDGAPAPYLAATGPDWVGLMVKWLSPGPGVLGHVDSTDALTDVMAEHRWGIFDGDIA